jgi:two-component system sensor histidine kinase KdpD
LENDALGTATKKDLLENIYDETNRLERLVTNLLEMTKLESGSVTLHRESLHPAEVIGSAIARIEKNLGNRALNLQIPSDLPFVPMDGLLMEQVLVNLLDNALKYTPDKSPIDISAKVDGKDLIVQVEDQGPGVSEEDLEHLFDKFYRGAQKGKKSGAGLGLSICKGIIQIHGGVIWAKNRPDGGSNFGFSIPLKSGIETVKAEA